MAAYTVSKLEATLDATGSELPGDDILLLGVMSKPNIEELHNAPSIPIARLRSVFLAFLLAVGLVFLCEHRPADGLVYSTLCRV